MQSSTIFSFNKKQLAAAFGHELDQFGVEVGINRSFGESDYSFRGKIHALMSGGAIFDGKPSTELMASQATLRDYFAAKASDEDVREIRFDYYENNYPQQGDRFSPMTRAQAKYAYADAMLAERAK